MDHSLPIHYQTSPSSNPCISYSEQQINSNNYTSCWLDDPYSISPKYSSQDELEFKSNDLEIKPDFNQITSELLNFLMEDDPVIIREAILLVHILIKEGGQGRLEVIRNEKLINQLLETFSKDIGDGKIKHVLANLFHSLSQQQDGLRVILTCNGISQLISNLDSSDNTINYLITILHNFLIVFQNESSYEIERNNGLEKLIYLLNNPNNKLLTLIVDILYKMINYNLRSKEYLQNNSQCIEYLLFIFNNNKYDKLLLLISKLFPIISSGNESIKRFILQLNGLNIFEKHIRLTKSIRIKHNCLITLRNISNQTTQFDNNDSLIEELIRILLTNDYQSIIYSLGILNNLTADKRINKSLVVKLNGIEILMEKLMINHDLIELILCILRHITARHDLENEAREILRKSNGIEKIIKLLEEKNFENHYEIFKIIICLIRNLTLSNNIITYFYKENFVKNFIQLLINIDNERIKFIENNKQYEILLEIILHILINLSKDLLWKTISNQMNTTDTLIRLTNLPSCSLQQSANILLNELNID